MYALVVRFDLLDEEAAAGFDALVARTAPHIVTDEPGTLVYAVHAVTDDPLARVFYEVYRDGAAFEAHEAGDHTRRFLEARGQYLRDSRLELLQPATGKLPAEVRPAE